MIICSICAFTEGPFIQESTGVPTSPNFYKCQSCAQDYTHISFDKTVGKGAPIQLVNKYFYPCAGCGSLFYNAIPYAYLNFSVKACPGCQHPFPSEKDIHFPPSDIAFQSVLKGSNSALTHAEIEEVFMKLTMIQPKISKAINQILLVELPKGPDIWVVCKGNDAQIQNTLRLVLSKETGRRMSFSSSQRYEFAMKIDGLKVLRQSD